LDKKEILEFITEDPSDTCNREGINRTCAPLDVQGPTSTASSISRRKLRVLQQLEKNPEAKLLFATATQIRVAGTNRRD